MRPEWPTSQVMRRTQSSSVAASVAAASSLLRGMSGVLPGTLLPPRGPGGRQHVKAAGLTEGEGLPPIKTAKDAPPSSVAG